MHKIIKKHKVYFQPLHMFRQVNCNSQGVFVKELQVLIAFKYAIAGFTVEIFTPLTCFNIKMHKITKLKTKNNNTFDVM